jgi:cyclopropane-fatty-acyl-phospholipid synthase
MSDTLQTADSLVPPTSASSPSASSWWARAARRAVIAQLSRLDEGELELVDGSASERLGRTRAPGGLRARITVRRPRAYARVALGGTMGGAEAYIDGDWHADDLTTLMRLFIRNRATAERVDAALGWLAPLHRLAHRWRPNSLRGSRENIAAHYDLGNDFFATFLDETMSYSCAVFPSPAAGLEEGSRHKIDLVCRKLGLAPGDDLLEIGSGWGELALHAAREYGCRVVTTTISRAQYDFVGRRVRESGLADRVTVLNADYRELPALLDRRFDKLASIEMVEAVGEAYLDRFFTICSRLLKASGLMLLQVIVIADDLFESYRSSVDYIQRYIFPGGFLPSRWLIERLAARHTDTAIAHVDDFTLHYARTLAEWRARFTANLPRVRALGYPERLQRMWEYYLCYCEGGFLERTIHLLQIVLAKPQATLRRLAPEGPPC